MPVAAAFCRQTLSVIGDVDTVDIDDWCIIVSFPADDPVVMGAKPPRSDVCLSRAYDKGANFAGCRGAARVSGSLGERLSAVLELLDQRFRQALKIRLRALLGVYRPCLQIDQVSIHVNLEALRADCPEPVH